MTKPVSSQKRRIPSKFKLLGKEITVSWQQMKDLSGECDHDGFKILIDPNQSVENQWATFFHETLHMALAISGHSYAMKEKEEEALVRALESAMAPIMRFNY